MQANATALSTAPRLILCVALAGLVACASARVHDPRMSEGVPFRIRPGVAWIEDFEIPVEMQADAGKREQAAKVMREVTKATVQTLIDSGYSARPAPPPDERELPPLGAVLVQGRFDEIHPGNAFGRILVGFGLGASRLHSDVELELLRGDRADSQPLFHCEVRASGSKMPGLIVPIGLASEIGLLINGLMKGVGELKGPLAGDARRTGEAIGRRLAAVFQALEWEGG
ncbi:MAG: DUF4410 domain-containing protein [Myxococcota bacterium]